MLAEDHSDTIYQDLEYIDLMRITINSEMFLIPVKAVLGILRPAQLTPVPMAPDHLMGVANIRGQIFCIIDPGKALHLKEKRADKTRNSRMLLLRHARVHLGFWVEEVMDLIRIPAPEMPEDSGHAIHVCEIETKHGALPVLRVDSLFD